MVPANAVFQDITIIFGTVSS